VSEFLLFGGFDERTADKLPTLPTKIPFEEDDDDDDVDAAILRMSEPQNLEGSLVSSKAFPTNVKGRARASSISRPVARMRRHVVYNITSSRVGVASM